MRTVYTNLPASFNPHLKEKHEGELFWATNRPEGILVGIGHAGAVCASVA